MRDFRSDNTHAASPEILDALVRASAGTMTSYGDDEITARVRVRCAELFEHDVDVFPVITGTSGNVLAIAAMTTPGAAIFCHTDAHIVVDELNAAEFFSGGAKLSPIAGANGKLDAEALARAIEENARDGSCVSITQATEAGTVYRADEIRALCDVAHGHGYRVHMDGARFANAVAHLGATPADLTWRAGVDALVFGATKNGALAVEVIVVFDRALATALGPHWHRGGHRPSKMRFLSAQFEAYLADDLWLRNARRANALAQRLAAGLPDVLRPVEANIVFVRLAPEAAASLQEQGFLFYDWPVFGADAYRLVVGFDSTEEEVDALVRAIEVARNKS